MPEPKIEVIVQSYNFFCLFLQVIGYPTPTVSWFKDEVDITYNPRYHIQYDKVTKHSSNEMWTAKHWRRGFFGFRSWVLRNKEPLFGCKGLQCSLHKNLFLKYLIRDVDLFHSNMNKNDSSRMRKQFRWGLQAPPRADPPGTRHPYRSRPPPRDQAPPPVDRILPQHASENITLPQTSFAGGKYCNHVVMNFATDLFVYHPRMLIYNIFSFCTQIHIISCWSTKVKVKTIIPHIIIAFRRWYSIEILPLWSSKGQGYSMSRPYQGS